MFLFLMFRFIETSLKWQNQMILLFKPWVFKSTDSDTLSVLQPDGAIFEFPIPAPKEMIEEQFQILLATRRPSFERYLTQMRKLSKFSMKNKSKASKSNETLTDAAAVCISDLSDNESENNSDHYHLIDPQNLEEDFSPSLDIEGETPKDVQECVDIAIAHGFFEQPDTDIPTLDRYNDVGFKNFESDELAALKDWHKTSLVKTLNTESEQLKTQLLRHYSLIRGNSEQRRAFGLFKEYVDAYIDGEKPEPIHLFVTGEAGTGKSLVLAVCRDYLCYKGLGDSYAVVAYTGKAASNVQGETLCKRFGLSTDKHRKQVC
jgi:hypothetical protein